MAGRIVWKMSDSRKEGQLYGWNEGMKAAAAQPEPLPRNEQKMPKYMTVKDRAEEAETLVAALAIVRTAELELDGKIPILPPQFARYLIAPAARLLVVPSTENSGNDRHTVANAMRISRCDALVVCISRPSVGSLKVILDIGVCGLSTVWHHEYRPCLLDGTLHFVPDHDASGPIFKLTQTGLTSSLDFKLVTSNEH
ncbi:MAG: hypothetical protein Q7T60_08540 [Sphingopyxis sp.]|nr:hypothetical protein [Sphingopyxis sp.]